MTIPGVSFQPGSSVSRDPTASLTKKPLSAHQEAIKILSLRLPRVVGARAIAPQVLLESPGSGGNPRVDSVVSQVMKRAFPTGEPGSGTPAPTAPPPVPVLGPQPGESHTMPVSPPVRYDGSTRPPDNTPLSNFFPPPMEPVVPRTAAPRITPGDVREENPTPVPETPVAPTGNVMNDFLEFLRRNQQPPMEQEPPPAI